MTQTSTKAKTRTEGQTFALIWKPTFQDSSTKPYIIGESTSDTLKVVTQGTGTTSNKVMYNQGYKAMKAGSKEPLYEIKDTATPKPVEFLTTFLAAGQSTQLILPLNSEMMLTKEFGYQLPNRVVQYQTLHGTSTTTFGRGVKKIQLRTVIIKRGLLWPPYVAGLEALSELSGNGYRYSGSLFLYAFNQTNVALGRKYKVTVESLVNNTSADTNNIISYEVNLIVNFDYSGQKAGVWGKL